MRILFGLRFDFRCVGVGISSSSLAVVSFFLALLVESLLLFELGLQSFSPMVKLGIPIKHDPALLATLLDAPVL